MLRNHVPPKQIRPGVRPSPRCKVPRLYRSGTLMIWVHTEVLVRGSNRGAPRSEPGSWVGEMAGDCVKSFAPSGGCDEAEPPQPKLDRRSQREPWCGDCLADLMLGQK
jgi:hypothetical protein